MKKLIVLVVVILLVGAGAGYYLYYARTSPTSTYKTAKAERGSIVATVSSTGTLAAVKTVLVGTQVSGKILTLFVDFNSPVKENQPIAQIDPTLFEAQVTQSRGNYLQAEANMAKAKVALADAKRLLEKNRRMAERGAIAQNDYENVKTTHDSAVAALKAAEGTVLQTKGALDQAVANLNYCTIRSPVDGIVLQRAVDEGQTVAASFQTPTLFSIVQDLSKMEIDTSVDEADIGRLKEGMQATFTVDSFPESRFRGQITQVRNAPIVTQNVVTYIVVIDVDNKDLRLKPGMTANVTMQVARKDDVLVIPAAALRFKPKGPSNGEARPTPTPAGPARRPKVGMQTVYVLSPEGTPIPVEVQTGLGDGSRLEVVSGKLKENDQVLVEQTTQKKKAGGAGTPFGSGH